MICQKAVLLNGMLMLCLLLGLCTGQASAEEPAIVKLPLQTYNTLIEDVRSRKKEPRPAPAAYVIGRSEVRAIVEDRPEHPVATVTVHVDFAVLEDEWTTVPIFPAGVSLSAASVGDLPAKLSAGPQGLTWSTNQSGNYRFQAKYTIDAVRSDNGYTLALYTPPAASITFSGILPESAQEIGLLPSAGTEILPRVKGGTEVRATIPSTSGFNVSWKTALTRGSVISRAEYSGVLDQKNENAIRWHGKLEVENLIKEDVDLDLIPRGVALREILIDGKPGIILPGNDRYFTRVRGEGRHVVDLDFQTPISHDPQAPQVALSFPQAPISRIELLFPERKELTVSPVSGIDYAERKDGVLATFYPPPSEMVTLSWAEPLPDKEQEALNASATFLHSFSAEEGALTGRSTVSYEITRGQTSVLELDLPDGIQVNKVSGKGTPVADWRTNPAGDGRPPSMQLFFDHEQTGELAFDIEYDLLLTPAQAKDGFSLPVLRSHDAHRQRGLMAFLASKDFGLKTIEESGATRVNESQLPAEFRQANEKSITHTFKFGDTPPAFKVQIAKPERRETKFDATVNTLYSVSDATLTASSTVDVDVKTGSMNTLTMVLPKSVNILGVTAPSILTQSVTNDGDKQLLEVRFTQEMEGQFRLDVRYEKLLAENELEIPAPTLKARDAEVQQGKIAVEAVAAIDVQPIQVEQLTSCDPSELPEQLLLKTNHPILHAFSFVRMEPAYRLGLKLRRHRTLDVQTAAIDGAHYETLFTSDGLAVTTARFLMRNSRKQFLRIDLPAHSKVWTASVDGIADKPALPEEDNHSSTTLPVLVRIKTSAQAFPVEVVYQTPVTPAGWFGVMRATLPRPDLVVTESSWDVYLPEELAYASPRTNMKVKPPGEPIADSSPAGERNRLARISGSQELLRVSVPTNGARYSFQKLYANQAADDAYFSILFVDRMARTIFMVVCGFMTLTGTFWLIRRYSVKPE